MRKQFEELLFSEMSINPKIYLIVGDLGYGLWDRIRDTFSDRFYNIGSSEMVMMGSAIGLAMDDMIPFVYSITPFAIYRPFEMIRNYLDHENIPVKIVGGGRDKDYGYLGFSHWAEEDMKVLNCFDNVIKYKPDTFHDLKTIWQSMVYNDKPTYLNLKKN